MKSNLKRMLSILTATLTMVCSIPVGSMAKAEPQFKRETECGLHDEHMRSAMTASNLAWDTVQPMATCGCSTSYAGTYTTYDVSSYLTIRAEHSSSSASKGRIPAGATFTVSKGNGTWAHVTYNGITGYASMSYMQKKPTSGCSCSTSYAGTYTTYDVSSYLTIRAEHSSSSASKGSIPAGATFEVSKGNGTWAHVTYNGITGYASMSYMKRVSNGNVSDCGCSTSYAGTYTTKNVSSSLRIRADHSLASTSTVVGTIPAGATFNVTMGNGKVAHVSYNGIEGYASMDYMQKVSDNTTPVSSGDWAWPMTSGYVCGNDWLEYYSARPARPYHLGLDIASGVNDTNVYAAAAGTVVKCGNNSANGNYVIISHKIDGKTIYSFYCHLSSYDSSLLNKAVPKGQKIGIYGNTGSSSAGKHLHFAIVDTLWSGSYWGYGTTNNSSADYCYYDGVTYYNPRYVIEHGTLPTK